MPDYAQYGIHSYGTARYGKAPTTDLSLSEFTAVPDGYGSVKVHWGIPVGIWDRLRLVRGAYGFATDELDGRIVLDVPNGAASSGVSDSVDELRFYYYSIFLRQLDGTWIRAGDTVVLTPKNYGTATRLYDLTPEVYREGDLTYTVIGTSSPYYGRGVLETYLSLFGEMLDTLRSEMETLLWVSDPGKMSGGLLPALAAEYGLPYEAELGMSLVRRQLNNIVYLYKMKGTVLGLEGAVFVFSGWAAKVTSDTNLMNTNDDAAFEFSTGRWAEQQNVVLSRQVGQGAVSNSGPGTLVMTAVAAGAMEARLPAGKRASLPLLLNPVVPSYAGPPALPLLFGGTPVQFPANAYGVPIPDLISNPAPVTLPLLIGDVGRAFTFSAYFWPVTTPRTVSVRMLFFDANNGVVGNTTGTPVVEVGGTWTRVTVTATAPGSALSAGFALVVAGAGAGEQHLVDALQFEPGSAATTWQPGNAVKVSLLADRVNMAENPSFEVSVANWTAVGCTLTQAAVGPFSGASVAQVSTTNGVKQAGIRTTNLIPVVAGAPYVFSSYWKAAATGRPIISTVTWYNAGGVVIGGATTGPVLSVPMLLNSILPAPDVVGSWTRAMVTAVAPAGAVSARYTATVIHPTATFGGAELHYVDGVLIEQANAPGDYFDATMGAPVADYRWEGAVGLSRSHYYRRRAVRTSRLTARLPDFMPAGSTLRIVDSQPL